MPLVQVYKMHPTIKNKKYEEICLRHQSIRSFIEGVAFPGNVTKGTGLGWVLRSGHNQRREGSGWDVHCGGVGAHMICAVVICYVCDTL